MSGSRSISTGKLLGAVAFAWEFAKDPIAGVTPFEQMVQYVRSSDRRIAAEAKDGEVHRRVVVAPPPDRRPGHRRAVQRDAGRGLGRRPGGDAADRDAAGRDRLQPEGARAPGRAVPPARPRAHGRRRCARAGDRRGRRQAPGARSAPEHRHGHGDFDLSGIGTVTHVEGNRVYGFGHPMFSLGACEFPMMTGYIHTVYPRPA